MIPLRFLVTVEPISKEEIEAAVIAKLNGAEKVPYSREGMLMISDAISELLATKVTVEIHKDRHTQ